MINGETNKYLTSLLPEVNEWIQTLQQQAEEEHVPIMDPLGIEFLKQQIRLARPKSILEIGTAIGYSALRMMEAAPDARIVTIEKDEYRYKQAVDNIRHVKLQEQIEVIHGDAQQVMEQLIANDEQFDFIFIDAAKGQYKRYFELADQMVVPRGIVVSDNVLFKNYVVQPELASKRHRKLVEKLRDYNDYLSNHPDYATTIVPIGDGVAISVKSGSDQ